MVKKIIVKKHYTDEQMKKKEGQFFDESCCKIYKENVDVYSEDGELLVKFRKNVLNDKECKILFDSRGAAISSILPSASGIPKGKSKYKKSAVLYILHKNSCLKSIIISLIDLPVV